jgi:hypothetical protein
MKVFNLFVCDMQGLPIGQLKSEYKQYFSEDIGPEAILPRGFKNSKHWDALFSLKEFKDDFTLFYMGTVVYVKAVRRRSVAEMKLIAQLAKHSHLDLARKAEYQCNCCTPDFWRNLARESSVAPTSDPVMDVVNQQHQQHMLNAQHHQQQQQQQQHQQHQQQQNHLQQQQQQQQHHHHQQQHHHHHHPEDIVVKIEPHNMMNNGDDDSGTGDGGAINRIHEGLYTLDQQVNHGNHHHHHQQHHLASATGFVNGVGGGGGIPPPDPSGSSASNMSSNTNDGFMLGRLYNFVDLYS